MKKKSVPAPSSTRAVVDRSLLKDISRMIKEARSSVAVTVNAGLTILYWQIGSRIRKDILQEKRAAYGQEILQTLSAELVPAFGRGFSEKSLRHMVRFAEAFPDSQIVSSLLRQLSWTHFVSLIYLEDSLKRDFYAEQGCEHSGCTRCHPKRVPERDRFRTRVLLVVFCARYRRTE